MFQTENVLVTSPAELIYNLGSWEGQSVEQSCTLSISLTERAPS